jgi:hypothetical protein
MLTLPPPDYCTEAECKRCRTHPDHRGNMLHAGIGKHPWEAAAADDLDELVLVPRRRLKQATDIGYAAGRASVEAERDAALALLRRCRPVIESEMAMMDSMARHMAGGFPEKDVQSADQQADFHWLLLKDIDAALKETPCR